MSTKRISSSAVRAREGARRPDGKFGEQHLKEVAFAAVCTDDTQLGPLASFEDVELAFDGQRFDDYGPADQAARQVADEYGYVSVVVMRSTYDPDGVADGEYGPDKTDDFEVLTFESMSTLDEWADDEGLIADGQVWEPLDEYQNPTTGRMERTQAFPRIPDHPAEQRRATHRVLASSVAVGDEVQHDGHWRMVTAIDVEQDEVSLEFEPTLDSEEDAVRCQGDDAVLRRERNLLSESEFARRFNPSGLAGGGTLELDDVAGVDDRHLWSVIETDSGELVATPGINAAARGYLQCDTAWDTDTPDAAWVLHHSEEDLR